MTEVTGIKKNDVVCIEGYGTANILHEHHVVTGVTKLYVKSTSTWSNVNKRPVSRRHRRDNGKSTPLGEYGGTEIYTTCQRPEEKRS